MSFVYSVQHFAQYYSSNEIMNANLNSHLRFASLYRFMLQYPDGRDDGDTCDIYWHNVVYHDMRSIVKGPYAKVNKFPGNYAFLNG